MEECNICPYIKTEEEGKQLKLLSLHSPGTFLGKVFEKIIIKRINETVEKKKIIIGEQYGFAKGRLHALLTLQH